MEGVGVSFANIGWKLSRHDTDESDKRNLDKLRTTVRAIVTELEPAVICFSEFGEVNIPLPDKLVLRLVQVIEEEWLMTALATKQIDADERVEYAHFSGEPYLTAWLPRRVDCRKFELLTDLFKASGEPRTAQKFLIAVVGEKDEAGENK